MAQKAKTFTDKVYDVVQKIRAGRVMTYADVARKAGSPRAVRAVGNILAKNTRPDIIPCHRVIRSDGKMGGYAFGGPQAKLKKLQAEGAL